MHFTLSRYACERLLYRLSKSQHNDSFVLKGAALLSIWIGDRFRATRDIDFLAFGEVRESWMAACFANIFAVPVDPDDGLFFDPASINVVQIREESEHGGLHLDAVARLGSTKIPVKIDAGFGDAVTPAAAMITVPSMLGFPSASLRGYPKETVVAEKLEAIVRIGFTNSRLKDYFDREVLARMFDFDGPTLTSAIQATFETRSTAVPKITPNGLTAAFGTDVENMKRWRGFRSKSGIESDIPLAEVVTRIDQFTSPIFARLAGGLEPLAQWSHTAARWQ